MARLAVSLSPVIRIMSPIAAIRSD